MNLLYASFALGGLVLSVVVARYSWYRSLLGQGLPDGASDPDPSHDWRHDDRVTTLGHTLYALYRIDSSVLAAIDRVGAPPRRARRSADALADWLAMHDGDSALPPRAAAVLVELDAKQHHCRVKAVDERDGSIVAEIDGVEAWLAFDEPLHGERVGQHRPLPVVAAPGLEALFDGVGEVWTLNGLAGHLEKRGKKALVGGALSSVAGPWAGNARIIDVIRAGAVSVARVRKGEIAAGHAAESVVVEVGGSMVGTKIGGVVGGFAGGAAGAFAGPAGIAVGAKVGALLGVMVGKTLGGNAARIYKYRHLRAAMAELRVAVSQYGEAWRELIGTRARALEAEARELRAGRSLWPTFGGVLRAELARRYRRRAARAWRAFGSTYSFFDAQAEEETRWFELGQWLLNGGADQEDLEPAFPPALMPARNRVLEAVERVEAEQRKLGVV